ncbi:hypothetical protein BC628DRAFT_1311267 [Trametes gibbosa]|nr:hypothetical protein BC628DRAFT_1311267 [Trametes gibbosa]
MQLHHWLPLVIALTPSLASAAIFPKDTVVKMVDAKDWKKVMKQNATSVVAFVAPWCGHCQKMAPEYSQAALGVYPMIPFYAVDCDKQSNKRLCAEQGVQGFPTLKACRARCWDGPLFPRGKDMKPIDFDYPTRTASAFYYWASRNIPHNVKKLYHLEELPPWVNSNIDKPRALLLNQGKGIPLLWQTLGNKYKDQITFGIHRDRYGKSSIEMGLEKGPAKSSKVLYYPPGSTDYVRYHGVSKHDPLSEFFDSILDGTIDLEALAKAAPPAEEVEAVVDEREREIERQQEEQRMKLAHGGYNDLIDFEEALKAGINPHAPGGAHADIPLKAHKKEGAKKEDDEDPIHRILKHQEEEARKEAAKPKMAQTGDGAQIVFDPAETGHPKTPVAGESAAPTAAEDDGTVTLSHEAAQETPTEEAKGHVTDEL